MISRRPPTNTVQASRYVVVDPQTLGRLRTLKLGDVELDLDGYRVIVRGTPAPLPRKEFMVLRQLMENAGQVVTRGARCWTTPGVRIGQQGRHYLPVHIRHIRQKIESNADRPSYIRTVRNVGYIFDAPDPINNTRSYIP